MSSLVSKSMEPSSATASPEFAAEAAASPEAELVALRERVAQMDRLAAIGQLSAGILHEIRNPLNFIVNYARLSGELVAELAEFTDKLADRADADELAEVLDMLEGNMTRIRENGDRAERIIQGMLAQTRGDAPHFEPTDLNALLEEFTKLAYQGVRATDASFNVTLAFGLDPAVGKVYLAPHEFNRVVINLVANACYAVNERGKLKQEGYKPTITVSSRKLADGIEVRIRDNGSGIPEAVRTKLFTPFFTTKPVGQGTGLGLALSRDIVQDVHRGHLSVESEPGGFTEFRIGLPLGETSGPGAS